MHRVLLVVAIQLEEVDATLLLLAEARERAERAAHTVAAAGGEPDVVDALKRVDQDLLVLHRRLMDEAIFREVATPTEGERQLALDAA